MSATVDTNAQPLMVLHQSITGQAVQLMAPFMPPSSDRPAYQSQSPKLSSIIAVNAGSASLSPGTSTVLDRYIHRSILGCGGPRTALRPVRARLTGGTASTSSDCLRVSLGGVRTQQLSKAQAELQRRRTDPSSPRQEILFKIHGVRPSRAQPCMLRLPDADTTVAAGLVIVSIAVSAGGCCPRP